MEIDYQIKLWQLENSPLEEITDEDDKELWGTLEENLLDELDEEYE